MLDGRVAPCPSGRIETIILPKQLFLRKASYQQFVSIRAGTSASPTRRTGALNCCSSPVSSTVQLLEKRGLFTFPALEVIRNSQMIRTSVLFSGQLFIHCPSLRVGHCRPGICIRGFERLTLRLLGIAPRHIGHVGPFDQEYFSAGSTPVHETAGLALYCLKHGVKGDFCHRLLILSPDARRGKVAQSHADPVFILCLSCVDTVFVLCLYCVMISKCARV